LWSENGTALLGLCGHFITRDWSMRNLLIGAVPCSAESHTGIMVDNETQRALSELGVTDMSEEIFVKLSDNGSNMKCGWAEGMWMGCRNPYHTDQLSVNVFCDHEDVKGVLKKCSGVVGYFNHSTLGKNTLHGHQKQHQLPQSSLSQWIRVRWRTCHSMTRCNSIRINQPAIVDYDIHTKKPGETFKQNKLQLEDYDLVEEVEAGLNNISLQNQMLEGVVMQSWVAVLIVIACAGEKYVTISCVLPAMCKTMLGLQPRALIIFPWRQDLRAKKVQLRGLKVAKAAGEMLKDMGDRRDGLPEVVLEMLLQTCILDARFKKIMFPGALPDWQSKGEASFRRDFMRNWSLLPKSEEEEQEGDQEFARQCEC
jgi:hypothetical protein